MDEPLPSDPDRKTNRNDAGPVEATVTVAHGNDMAEPPPTPNRDMDGLVHGNGNGVDSPSVTKDNVAHSPKPDTGNAIHSPVTGPVPETNNKNGIPVSPSTTTTASARPHPKTSYITTSLQSLVLSGTTLRCVDFETLAPPPGAAGRAPTPPLSSTLSPNTEVEIQAPADPDLPIYFRPVYGVVLRSPASSFLGSGSGSDFSGDEDGEDAGAGGYEVSGDTDVGIRVSYDPDAVGESMTGTVPPPQKPKKKEMTGKAKRRAKYRAKKRAQEKEKKALRKDGRGDGEKNEA